MHLPVLSTPRPAAHINILRESGQTGRASLMETRGRDCKHSDKRWISVWVMLSLIMRRRHCACTIAPPSFFYHRQAGEVRLVGGLPKPFYRYKTYLHLIPSIPSI